MSHLRGPANLLALLGLTAFVVTLLWHPAVNRRFTGLTEVRSKIPTTVGEYHSPGEEPADKVVRAALGTADMSWHTYTDSIGQTVQLILIGGTDRNALHDPRSCLIGSGWEIENDHTEPISGTNIAARVCHITSKTGSGAMEVLYLYVVDGQVVTEVTQIRSQMLVSALIGKRNRPVCFVRFVRPLLPSADADATAHTRFMSFVGTMWNTMELDKGIQDN